ncbi:MAG: arginine--tRNA ligase, partial [Treponema sp.]|nr:arginine--tRNA ligase [Treponema sp.]
MYNYKEAWKDRIAGALNRAIKDAVPGGTIDPSRVIAEIPPRPEMGDLGFPMFSFAKDFRQAPPRIAQAVLAALDAESPPAGSSGGTYTALGPYINVRLDRGEAAAAILAAVPACEAAGPAGEGAVPPGGDFPFGRPGTLAGRRIMVEFSSPNTNKPLHLGHLRNDVLGESVSRILRACGAEVRKVCIINDRGIHICKSMLAYQEYGEGKTPESEQVKSDRFVGDWYVKFHHMAGESATAGAPKPEERAQELLRRWEAGDPETVALWKQMNRWAVDGMKETYRRTGVSFDQYYFESQTYLLGKD